MIDYYETKSQPITRLQVWQAYWKVRKNKGGMGIDGMRWEELDKERDNQLYKLWNRLSSGSYYPPPVKEVEIDKKDGGKRKLKANHTGNKELLLQVLDGTYPLHLASNKHTVSQMGKMGERPVNEGSSKMVKKEI